MYLKPNPLPYTAMQVDGKGVAVYSPHHLTPEVDEIERQFSDLPDLFDAWRLCANVVTTL